MLWMKSLVDTGIFNMIPGEYSRRAKMIRKEARFTHSIALPHCPSSGNSNPAAFVLTSLIVSLWFLEWGNKDRTVNSNTRKGQCHEVAFFPGNGADIRHSASLMFWLKISQMHSNVFTCSSMKKASKSP